MVRVLRCSAFQPIGNNCQSVFWGFFCPPPSIYTASLMNFCIFCSLCPTVQNPLARLLVWGVWRNPRWLSHRNGEPAGGATDSTFARRGEPVGAWFHLLPEPVFRRLPHQHHPPPALPAWPHPIHHRGGTLAQVRAHLTLGLAWT